MRGEAPLTWSLVVPVKVRARAQSRLAALAGPRRPALGLAVAADTVRAALGCPRVRHVIVVTGDELAAEELGRLGAVVVGDEPDAGLNPALVYGAGEAAARDPRSGVGALSADRPPLRPAQLDLPLPYPAPRPQATAPDPPGLATPPPTPRPAAPSPPMPGPLPPH